MPNTMASSQSPAHSPVSSISHKRLVPSEQSSFSRFSVGNRHRQMPAGFGLSSTAARTCFHPVTYAPSSWGVLVTCEVYG